ncbi:MAG: class I SAM-dependent methyltransferase [Brevundimonas sp.]|uniref:class I SAM-dependent methyltransferase n=1 Tax=Brevundimonas sp. TaxID=1871086 RepID=UPI0024886AEA|nr:class I SAM-dependent methyltransferase [Brevundimonas sp.]MDI1325517.1 class I SAM-dependent methyltransferase [Brevundimonas sp.]
MHWKAKSAAFRILSAVPFGGAIHHALQRHVTHEWPRPDSALDELFVGAQALLSAAAIQGDLSKTRFLEIGAGRDLSIALAVRMMGVGSVTTLDVDRLARIDLINQSAQYMARRLGMTVPVFASFDDLIAFGVDYRAPMRITGIDEEHFDCFYSVDTLEHIPPTSLIEILAAARARLKPDGVTVHMIDYSDHYARGGGVSRVNFLRYSDRQWEPHNSRFLYMNRLRHSQFLDLFEKAGFRSIDAEPFRLDPAEVPMDEVDARFRAMSIDDVATLRAQITARP